MGKIGMKRCCRCSKGIKLDMGMGMTMREERLKIDRVVVGGMTYGYMDNESLE